MRNVKGRGKKGKKGKKNKMEGDSKTNRLPTLLEEKNPGVFQSNLRIFQVLLVIVCSQISNTFGLQSLPNSYQT